MLEGGGIKTLELRNSSRSFSFVVEAVVVVDLVDETLRFELLSIFVGLVVVVVVVVVELVEKSSFRSIDVDALLLILLLSAFLLLVVVGVDVAVVDDEKWLCADEL